MREDIPAMRGHTCHEPRTGDDVSDGGHLIVFEHDATRLELAGEILMFEQAGAGVGVFSKYKHLLRHLFAQFHPSLSFLKKNRKKYLVSQKKDISRLG